MSQYTKYKLYKLQRRISGSSDTWIDVVPTTYSYDGNGTQTPVIVESASTDCGYVPPLNPIYEWRNMNINTDYICENCNYTNYLTFKALERGKFTFSNSVSYSLDDGATWVNLSSNTQTPYIEANETIMWKSNLIRNGNGIGHFSSTGMYEVNGNVMSLMYGDNFQKQVSLSGLSYQFAFLFQNSTKLVSAENFVLPSNELTTYCYEGMFENCTMLTKAPKLIATTLNAYCYYHMFRGCTSLTEAPDLPATTLAQDCYAEMFVGCTSLTKAPELQATTLAQECYGWMFSGCTSLTTAPELLATTLANGCYGYMFYGCTALTTPPSVLPATRASSYCYYNMFVTCRNITKSPDVMLTSSASHACTNMFFGCSKLSYIKAMFLSKPSGTSGYLYWTQNWVNGVAASGTFVKNSAATWNVSGVDGIPTNWTVILSD